MNWKLRTRTLHLGRIPLVMGILNVTPDSFSDGGKFSQVDAAVAQAIRMEKEGAAILDIGAESTRPFSVAVSAEEQLLRLIPVLERLAGEISIPISIDTQSAAVARAAVDLGAEIINDVSGLEADPEMMPFCAAAGVGVCVMHMQGTPQTMQIAPHYEDVVQEIRQYLQQRFDQCLAGGIEPARICLDPGVGFGKTHEHNLTLLRGMREITSLAAPILVGHSRKGFIGHVLGDKTLDRTAGTLGTSLALAAAGVHVLRVHDVGLTVQALQLFAASGGLR